MKSSWTGPIIERVHQKSGGWVTINKWPVYRRKELGFPKRYPVNPICGDTEKSFSLQFLGAKISGVVQISL